MSGESGGAKPPIEGWAVIELMGHRRLGGYVSEVEVFGAKMCRIDVPYGPGEPGEGFAATQFVGGGSIYCLTLTTEEVAREAAFYGRPRAVSRLALEPPRAGRDDPDEPGPDDCPAEDAGGDPFVDEPPF